ncbi:MAG: GNAT family N-acetyltransferase [Alphaproteobacteria bacterium HGW-Alphaproteobacteria-1]|jgi:phosphinothricin acetyltransferase|nr:MAG: GNAT family N-acetyltransferase [Alphaproteobacteria bacterium HGW-Alphaproteobacteria-1]
MILRAATPADIPAILAIWNPLIRDTSITFTTVEKTPETLGADIAARGPAFLVAETGGALVGFASYGPFRSGPGYVHTAEHTVILDAQTRGQGVGRTLMARLAEVARTQGIHVLIGAVSGTNGSAIAFHEAIGFDRVGLLPQVGRKFGNWLDLVLLQKTL